MNALAKKTASRRRPEPLIHGFALPGKALLCGAASPPAQVGAMVSVTCPACLAGLAAGRRPSAEALERLLALAGDLGWCIAQDEAARLLAVRLERDLAEVDASPEPADLERADTLREEIGAARREQVWQRARAYELVEQLTGMAKLAEAPGYEFLRSLSLGGELMLSQRGAARLPERLQGRGVDALRQTIARVAT